MFSGGMASRDRSKSDTNLAIDYLESTVEQ